MHQTGSICRTGSWGAATARPALGLVQQRCSSARSSKQQRTRTRLRAYGPPSIKVVGVGGVASSAVGQLWDNEALSHIQMMIINTDLQELSQTWLPDHDKLLIGGSTTKWQGTGGDPRLGQDAAEESRGDISRALQGADLVLLLAGMGGGTGSGAAPVVADVARQQGAFTIGITLGSQQQQQQQQQERRNSHIQQQKQQQQQQHVGHMQQQGVVQHAEDQLQSVVDACVAVVGEQHTTQWLLEVLVAGLADLLTGFEPVDLDELQAALGGGTMALGSAVAHGPGRCTRATFAAISSHDLRSGLQQATGLVCFVNSEDELEDNEVQEISDILGSQCPAAEPVLLRQVRTGPSVTAALPAGSVSVTVLAAVHTPSETHSETHSHETHSESQRHITLSETQSQDTLSEAQSQDIIGSAASDAWGLTGGLAGASGGVRSLADIADAAAGAGGHAEGGVGDADVQAEEEGA